MLRLSPRGVCSTLLLLAFAPLGCTKPHREEGASGSQSPGPYRFAFVTNNSADFWNIAEKGLRKAEKDLGVKVDVYRPLKGEVADQQRFLEDIIVKKYDGVAISPISPDALTGTFERVAANMPLVCDDSDAPNSKRSAYVGTNNVEAGRAAGQAAIDALKAAGITKGKVGIFVGRIDARNAVERKQGIDEALAKMPGIEPLPVFLDHMDRALAKKNVEDALARYPDLVLALGIWSYNGPCMAGAVRASTRPTKPILIAFDEDEETLQAVKDGIISASVVQKPFEIGYRVAATLKSLKDGQVVPKTVDTGILVVTRKNLDAFWAELRELKK